MEVIGEETGNSNRRGYRCCCIPVSNSAVGWWDKLSATGSEGKWYSFGIRTLKRIREWSELVAGPQWKTFIRRFNRCKSGNNSYVRAGPGGNLNNGTFQYDPMSYSLNFDEGPGQNCQFDLEDDYYGGPRDFSARYAAVPTSVK